MYQINQWALIQNKIVWSIKINHDKGIKKLVVEI